MTQKYDAIIIGAGMSAMAAGIRLAMFDKKVLILERHAISGGLNSYYQRGKRSFDVGLHALTNFAAKGERRKPLTKLLKQLRIPYDSLELNQQSFSQIVFPDQSLTFTNDFSILQNEISEKFPDDMDGFLKLHQYILEFNETALENPYQSARELVSTFIKSEQLVEMIFCPLLIYGSAWEMDMDFSQFVIMYKSIFVEGFSRPKGGVRTIINLLLNKLEEVGCEVRFKCGVQKILTQNGKTLGIITDKGETIYSNFVLSSAGLPETQNLLEEEPSQKANIGKLSFTESILISEKKPKDYDQKATILFYNNRPQYLYRRPDKLYDNQSAVICFPNNFEIDDYEEGWIRLTMMANFQYWKDLLDEDKKAYKAKKEEVCQDSIQIAQQFLKGWDGELLFKDIFSPTTISRYTSHFAGTVYGSPDKSRDGRTHIEGLAICGTDQGFLGIVGSMLSGISMANLHGLMESR